MTGKLTDPFRVSRFLKTVTSDVIVLFVISIVAVPVFIVIPAVILIVIVIPAVFCCNSRCYCHFIVI